MSLQSVTDHPSFQRALAWLPGRHGEAPPRWLPDGLARLDDSWFAAHPIRGARQPPAAAFDGLPARLAQRARAACGAAPTRLSRLPGPICQACARWCWSDLVDLPPQAADEPGLLADTLSGPGGDPLAKAVADVLTHLSASTVLAAVSLAGLTDLGGLLAHASDRTAASVCGRLPAHWQKRVWQARGSTPPPDRASLVQLQAMTASGDPTETLFSLGARRFAKLLAPWPLLLQQTAQLLPVPVARHLLGATWGPPTPDPHALAKALDEAAQHRDVSRA